MIMHNLKDVEDNKRDDEKNRRKKIIDPNCETCLYYDEPVCDNCNYNPKKNDSWRPSIKYFSQIQTLLKEIEDECIDGLNTDGAHHKQYVLETILKLIGKNPDNPDWEKGIPW